MCSAFEGNALEFKKTKAPHPAPSTKVVDLSRDTVTLKLGKNLSVFVHFGKQSVYMYITLCRELILKCFGVVELHFLAFLSLGKGIIAKAVEKLHSHQGNISSFFYLLNKSLYWWSTESKR